MPTGIGRDDLQKLTGQGAQLVEVLPVEDYDWAHLPGAVNLPLKQLDTSTGRLDRSRPVIWQRRSMSDFGSGMGAARRR